MTQPYRAIFFDADDTIFDYRSGENAAFAATAREFGLQDRLEDAQMRYRKHNADVWRALEEGRITQDALKIERFHRVLADLGENVSRAPEMSVYYLDRLSEQTILLDGAENVIAKAAEHFLLVLVTNGLTSVQRRRFAAAPVTGYFKDILISEELGVAKPDPAIFSPAMEKHALCPEEVLMVGDSTTSDMPAARNAGMDFCWVNPAGEEVPDGFAPRWVVRDLPMLAFELGLDISRG
ncbi:YjjG family noncanonical pyrimidine nucleotidase [bacterium]|nr:YjjG family noncanonical pyrimidine nucleotidase [bacterium]